tara:strand:+ start:14492 stop:14965 length:474 start_codon:yes stop_codon:yes gene_type:complete
MKGVALKDHKHKFKSGEPHCPYCISDILHWPSNRDFSRCSICERVLWLFPRANSDGERQILCFIDAGRTYVAVGTTLFFLSIFLLGYFSGAIIVFCVFVLLPFGAFDLMDAYDGYQSKIQRLTRYLFEDRAANLISMFKFIWGMLTISLAISILVIA